MEFYECKKIKERVILVGVQAEETRDVETSLDELEELADTAGAVTVGRVIQNREAPHPGTYIGKDKIAELRLMIDDTEATGIICDDELSPAQMNNLEHELDCKVLDRTMLILDIFAGRATSSEGKIQVELAQLRYRSSRLVGLRSSLSRLGGGIGTRGPGEKQLEMDLADGQQILLTDTVGFIRKLPHHLVEAFKSTLEEAKYADYIIHVVDALNPHAEEQMQVVYETLDHLGVTGQRIITLFNKQDITPENHLRDSRADVTLGCSARTGEGLDQLREALSRFLSEEQVEIETLYAYNELGKIGLIREHGTLLSEEYTADGVLVRARIPRELQTAVTP